MADQKNCSKGNVQCKGSKGIRCKSSCSNRLKNKTNIKQLDKLVDTINKAKDIKDSIKNKNKVTEKVIELAEDSVSTGIVEGAGLIGSTIGSSAGPLGSLTGSFLASTAAKHSLLLRDSIEELAGTVEFDSLSRVDKAKAILDRAKQNDKKADALEEAAGFAVGNFAPNVMKFVPDKVGSFPVPKGMIAAIATVPSIRKYLIDKKLKIE